VIQAGLFFFSPFMKEKLGLLDYHVVFVGLSVFAYSFKTWKFSLEVTQSSYFLFYKIPNKTWWMHKFLSHE
jgi:hypothetical protein